MMKINSKECSQIIAKLWCVQVFLLETGKFCPSKWPV